MSDIQTTMPMVPQGYSMSNDGAFGGQGGIWMILLVILLLGRNGNGLFGGGGADTNTVIGLTNEGLALRTQEQLANATNRINDNVANGFSNVNNGICSLNTELIRGFGSITHQNDLNTCRLETAIHAEGEATRALIQANQLQETRDALTAARNELSDERQASRIINTIHPCPVPAYGVCNPNTVTIAPPFGFAPFYGGNHCDGSRCW